MTIFHFHDSILEASVEVRSRTMKEPSLDHQWARELIATHLGVALTAVTDQAEFTADLGADSLDLVELTMQFENALNVSITGEESERCACVEDVLTLLDSKLTGAQVTLTGSGQAL